MLTGLNSMECCITDRMDMTVLERLQSRLKWLQQQNYAVQNYNPVEFCASSGPQFHGLLGGRLGGGQLLELKKQEVYPGSDDFHKFVNFSAAGPEFGGASKIDLEPPETAADYCISRTSSSRMTGLQTAVTKKEGEDVILEKMESNTGKLSFNKRKAEAVAKDKCQDKKIKGDSEVSIISSKENSKASEVHKPDYIYVRARRGKATDSHSLAERARREKISKKMKCLQDLVPGCSKITGKAGMLDEIINYVQSLQRQVEFLSMKFAVKSPTVEFNVDNLPVKEKFPAHVANFPPAAKSSSPASANLASLLQLNPLQKEAMHCMLNSTMHPPQKATEGIASASSVSVSEQALTASCITQLQPFSTWNSDTQGLYNSYNMGFH